MTRSFSSPSASLPSRFLFTLKAVLNNPHRPPLHLSIPSCEWGFSRTCRCASELENRDGLNSFDVTRAYLNINAQMADRVRFRFTPDAPGDRRNSRWVTEFASKCAFPQVDNVGPRSWIRFGLAQTPWLDFEESVNRYRVQGTMFSEREGLIPGSADFGAGCCRLLPGNYGSSRRRMRRIHSGRSE